LTFASLPAREPLKTSIGARVSRTSHLDQKKSLGPSRNSQSLHHGQAPPHPATRRETSQIDDDDDDDDDDDLIMDDSHIEILGHDDSEDEQQEVRQHTKSSTQRLHDKIEMLGKAPAPRPSKSIPSAMQLAARQSGAPRQSEKTTAQPMADDDDSWIKPLNSPNVKQVATQDEDEDGHESNDEEVDLRAPELIAHEERMRTPLRMSPSPGKQRPGFGHAKSASTATLASPAKLDMDVPPSPAKSISVSNPARPATTPQGSPRRYLDLSASKSKLQSIMKTAKGLFTSSAGVSAAAKLETLSPKALRLVSSTMPGMYPSMDKMIEDNPLPTSPPKEGRKTRSSTEREKEEKRKEKDVKAMQKMDDQLGKAREKEAQKAAQQKQQYANTKPEHHSPKRVVEDKETETADANQQSKATRFGKPAPKGKPAPVSIRVGTHSQRMPLGSSIMNSNQETLPAEPKRPGLNKKASNASIQSTASTFRTSVQAQPAKPRALLAAERKREQDEREAQRKLEQKREMERKRAAQQEEARKQEAKGRAEAERKERERITAEQAKRQAQQQAIERKRQENARKAEQQRLERERAAAESAAAARPPSRLGNQPVGRALINHPLPTNPAKPPKRPLEEENARPQAPKYGAASQQQDAKRRRTDEEVAAEPVRPTMSGAPIRQSNLGKKPSIFAHPGYAPAPQPAHLSQFPQPPTRAQPPVMAQYANNKIPFADAPNPPAPAKTPLSAYQHKTIQAVKSSPQYPNGEQIHLPEIPTDSEDEDSEDEGNGFPIPDWATPGHLTEQLVRQEAMDGDVVFGPIAPLKMEEIFAKGNKERLKRLKDRTSSANWVKSGDALTLEEVRIDREQRERMRLEGGWRYGS
jgi:Inner centromere protein, ARK binding region